MIQQLLQYKDVLIVVQLVLLITERIFISRVQNVLINVILTNIFKNKHVQTHVVNNMQLIRAIRYVV